MKPLFFLGAACALALSSCGTPNVAPPSVQLASADAGTVIDASYSSAQKLFLAAAPSMAEPDRLKIKALFDKAIVYVRAADNAAAVGDSATVGAQAASATKLINQIKGLLPAS